MTIPPTGCFYVELDTEAIAGEVFGLLIEKFKETTNLSHDSNVEQLGGAHGSGQAFCTPPRRRGHRDGLVREEAVIT